MIVGSSLKRLRNKDIVLKKKVDSKSASGSSDQNLGLSTNQILEEIGYSVNKEKERRSKFNKKNLEGVMELGVESLLKGGDREFDTPMSEDFATLKCLIQNIVRQEISKLKKD